MIDISGKTFGRLKAIEPFGKTKSRVAVWKCVCECGNVSYVDGSSLRTGRTRSCGCLNKENSSLKNTIHGKSTTRVYKIWQKIKDRCHNKKNDHFNCYGGRGITVCEEWEKDFMSFYNWAMRHGYRDDLTIDRIDVNGNYCPENCRWSTQKEQTNNTRKNKILEMKGEKHTLKQWSEIKNINYSSLRKRIKLGWGIEKALLTPIKQKGETNGRI